MKTTISANCQLVAVPTISFGAYDPVGSQKTTDLDNTVGQIEVSCVGNSAITVALDFGTNATGSPRKLKNASSADYLNYDLYKPDATNTCVFTGSPVVWGNSGTALFTPPAAPPNLATHQFYRICARVFKNQDPTVGTYSDRVNATVNF